MEFKKRYYAELEKNKQVLKDALDHKHKEIVTFVYASKEKELNNAGALKEYVEKLFR